MMHGFEGQAIPPVFAFLAIAAEFSGGIGLILGFLSRIAAFGITVNMIVAIFTVHLPNGFSMNWTGRQKGEGYEFHLLASPSPSPSCSPERALFQSTASSTNAANADCSEAGVAAP